MNFGLGFILAIDKQKRRLICETLIFLIVTVVFSQAIFFQFISLDDPQNITSNISLKIFNFECLFRIWKSTYFGLYIPMTYTIWAGVAWISEFVFSEIHPATFHILNILVHAFNAVILFQIILLCIRDSSTKALWAATSGSLLFALHPAQVEAVAWASGARDLLGAFFGLLAIRIFLLGIEQPSNRFYWRVYFSSTLFFGLSILSKPNGIILPVFLFLLSFWQFRIPIKKVGASMGLWLVASAPIIFMSRAGQPESVISFMNGRLPWWQRPLVFIDSLFFYFKKLIAPFPLLLDYGRAPASVLADNEVFWKAILLFLILGIIFLIMRFSRGALKPLGEGLLYFIILLLPVSGYIAFEFQIFSTVSDRYLYFPMVGISIGLSLFLINSEAFWRRNIFKLALMGLGALLAVGTLSQLPVWKNSESVLQHAIEGNPKSYLANQSLAVHYFDVQAFSRALIYFQLAVELNPHYLDPKFGLGKSLLALNRPHEAVNFYRSFLTDKVNFPSDRGGIAQVMLGNILTDYGIALEQIGAVEDSKKQFQRALEVFPEQPTAKARLTSTM